MQEEQRRPPGLERLAGKKEERRALEPQRSHREETEARIRKLVEGLRCARRAR